MRITLNMDIDVMLAATPVAACQERSIDAVTLPSRLARLGIQSLPKRGGVVSNDLINQPGGDGVE